MILGQERPAQNTEVQLYVVPTGSKAEIQLFHVCNMTLVHPATPEAIRVRVLPSGTSATADQYLVLDWFTIENNKILDLFTGINLNDGDQIVVLAKSGRTTFSLFGTTSVDADADLLIWGAEIASGDFTHANRYALLTGGGYNVNINTNSCP